MSTFDQPDAVSVSERPLQPAAGLSYEFPAHSVTVLRIDVA